MSLIEEALRIARVPVLHPQAASTQPRATETHPEDSVSPDYVTGAPQPPSPEKRSWQSSLASLCLMAAAGIMVATVVLAGTTWWSNPLMQGPTAIATFSETASTNDGSTVSWFGKSAGLANRNPLIEIAGAQKTFNISGVAKGSGPSFAVINGEILAVGETVNGAKLVEILESSVRLRTEAGEEIALAIPY